MQALKQKWYWARCAQSLRQSPLAKTDYVSMVDALTMQPVEKVEKDVLVAMAVYIGKTRLIDNFSFQMNVEV